MKIIFAEQPNFEQLIFIANVVIWGMLIINFFKIHG